jgi:hypothetical protein
LKNPEFQLKFDLIYLNNDVTPNQMKDSHEKLINEYSKSNKIKLKFLNLKVKIENILFLY